MNKDRPHVFIDTSVLFAACKSSIGASAIILGECRRGTVQGYISPYVISEAKKNVSAKLNQRGKQRLNFYLQQGHFTLANEAPKEEIQLFEQVIHPKDAPIIAAALKTKASILITLNTTDFKKTNVQKSLEPIKIMTPREYVTIYLQ